MTNIQRKHEWQPLLVEKNTLGNYSFFFFYQPTLLSQSISKGKWAEMEGIWTFTFSVPLKTKRNTSKIFPFKDFRVDSCNILFQQFPSERAAPSIHLSIHRSTACMQPDNTQSETQLQSDSFLQISRLIMLHEIWILPVLSWLSNEKKKNLNKTLKEVKVLGQKHCINLFL